MICCGAECDTPFCPQCGKRLGGNDLSGLLQYLRRFQQQSQRRLDMAEELLAKDPDRGRERGRNRRAARLSVWKGWADALESLMRKAKEPL